MGWKESDRVSERLEFVRFAEAGEVPFTVLCARFGVSRKTGYKWLKRWRAEGAVGLVDQSRRPVHSPSRTPAEVEQEVLNLRKKHPRWGGRKIRQRLLVLGVEYVPSASSITRILHRHGLICPAESSKHTAFCRFERGEPNDLWQIDFKGDFLLSGGKRCYPLTILDDHSRYSLGVIACGNQKRMTVQTHFREVFSRYGIPRAIYVDNGNPWGTSRERTRHSRLSAWLMRQDIEVIHGRPYSPQGRGKLERFHRTLRAEVLQDRQLETLMEAQEAFDPWRTIYNHERPHESLNQEVPATRYCSSRRSFQEVMAPFSYSSRFEVRRPNPTGQFRFQNRTYRISDAFTDQGIGLSPTEVDGVWDIYYCRFRIGYLDQRAHQITYDRRLAAARKAHCSQADGGKSAEA